MNCLEIFSGAGGLAKGLELSGFKHSKFIEFNKHACASLRKNFSSSLIFEGDIRNFQLSSLKDIDLIAGGPPCQPFSLGGKHQAHQDPRDMFPHAAQAVGYYQPKAFLFENVKGLLRKSFSPYLDYIIMRLTFPEVKIKSNETWDDHLIRLKKIDFHKFGGIKYKVSYKLLNAADYGIPQTRERVFIVGIRSDVRNEWTFPEKTHSKRILFDEQFNSGIYWEHHNISPPEDFSSEKKCMINFSPETEAYLKPWKTVRDALKNIPHPSEAHGIFDHIFRPGAKIYPGHTGSFIDAPAKTLKAGGHGVPGGENMIRYTNNSVRYFSVYEGKLLQTFPSDFHIMGAWGEAMRQIGNAVPTKLAQIIGHQLYKLICYEKEKKAAA